MMKRQQCICNHCTHYFHKTLLLLIVLYVGRTYPPSRLLIFLSYTMKISFSLPIPYKFLTFKIVSIMKGLK
ncbi:conserved hypothetical protein [Bacillus mycoides]|uniref:Uncharacterized protein n=1 Tax=Bacillus mycoides TaxID=1405 RepID=A0A654BQ26_BACMY|nr:conserved hypothetical protein [Bacillus mycoides]